MPPLENRAASNNERKPFSTRAFVASAAVISGIGLPGTGLGIHLCAGYPITPAYHAWMTIHWSLAIVFAVFAVWHIAFNRRALSRYLRAPRPWPVRGSREAISAIALVTLVLLAAIAHLYAL